MQKIKLIQDCLQHYFPSANITNSHHTAPGYPYDFVDHGSNILLVSVGDSWTWGSGITGKEMDTHSTDSQQDLRRQQVWGHPFILHGNPYSLKTLKDWGFETYDNWFDESYDRVTDLNMKIEHICNEIARPSREYDDVTKHKINHNVERFWNRELVHQIMVDEIIQPMLNFIKI